MCENTYVNIQTGEVLDMGRVTSLKDNALLKIRPDLWCEWDFEKNDELDLDIWKMTISNGKYVHWICENQKHKWDTRVADRGKGKQGCPYCSNHRLKVGFNSMWDTNYKLASLLAKPEDGYKYMQCSIHPVDWKCPDCFTIIKNRKISLVNKKGLACPNCSDGKSYPEKFMYFLLRELGLNFEWESTFEWSLGKRYDFSIDYEGSKFIIECHGKQHYNDGFEYLGGRTLEEEQENDRLKEKLAKENGIDYYIVIDCRKSFSSFIKEEIMNSCMPNLFPCLELVDWDKISSNSEKSLVFTINNMWKDGNKNISELARIVKLHVWTISHYLKKGKDNGWNDYCPDKSKLNGGKSRRRKIVKIGSDDGVVFESARKAHFDTGIDSSSIIAVCKGKRKTAGGFKWMYLEDYEKQYGKIDE